MALYELERSPLLYKPVAIVSPAGRIPLTLEEARGAHSFVMFEKDGLERVFAVARGKRSQDKDAIAMAHARAPSNPHLPAVAKLGQIKDRDGYRNLYQMPRYHVLDGWEAKQALTPGPADSPEVVENKRFSAALTRLLFSCHVLAYQEQAEDPSAWTMDTFVACIEQQACELSEEMCKDLIAALHALRDAILSVYDRDDLPVVDMHRANIAYDRFYRLVLLDPVA